MRVAYRQILPRATTVGLGLIILLLVVNLILSELNIRRLVGNEQRVVATQEVLTTLEAVVARVTESETAERGYVITNDARFLEPYEASVARTHETLEGLLRLLADDPEQGRRIAALQELVRERVDELRQAIAARQ